MTRFIEFLFLNPGSNSAYCFRLFSQAVDAQSAARHPGGSAALLTRLPCPSQKAYGDSEAFLSPPSIGKDPSSLPESVVFSSVGRVCTSYRAASLCTRCTAPLRPRESAFPPVRLMMFCSFSCTPNSLHPLPLLLGSAATCVAAVLSLQIPSFSQSAGCHGFCLSERKIGFSR